MADLQLAIAGAGFWAGYQVAAWKELPGVRCTAICDTDRDKAARLADRLSIPHVYTDVAAMLDEIRPDLLDVIAAVPSHRPLVQLAAGRGVAVICQKPMAESFDECVELVECCRRAGCFFAIHENWRWQAALRHVKQLLDEGRVGTPYRARIEMISGFDVFANQPALRQMDQFIISDMGCHLLDLARCYFGEADLVYCQTTRIRPEIRGEDVATVQLRMNQGRTAVAVNMAYAGTPLERECFPQTLVFIEGSEGSLEVTPDCWVRLTDATGTLSRRIAPPVYGWANPDYAVVHSSIVNCHANLLAAVRGEGRAETQGADNLRTMQLVDAAYRSAATGRTIDIAPL
jgi:predicted dehydrogenase